VTIRPALRALLAPGATPARGPISASMVLALVIGLGLSHAAAVIVPSRRAFGPTCRIAAWYLIGFKLCR